MLVVSLLFADLIHVGSSFVIAAAKSPKLSTTKIYNFYLIRVYV